MSERFIRGWKLAPQKLLGLVGARRPAAPAVIQARASAGCREDVLMTLGDGDEAEGASIADAALTALLAGRLTAGQAYNYARVTELLLNRVAVPLGNTERAQILMQLTYHVPNDTPGRWNPLLRACRLPALAKTWGKPNWPFPWRAGSPKSKWPTWTIFEGPLLDAVAAELKTFSADRVAAAPDRLFADNPDDAPDCRAELIDGLLRLRAWIAKARAPHRTEGPGRRKRGNALVLLMDGDQ